MKQPELGLKIIFLRQSKGLTQEELVKQCNISIRTLQRIESGEVVPRGYTLRLISKVLDFDFFSLSEDIPDQSLPKNNSSKSEPMSNLDKAIDILIKRYAYLSMTSVEKAKVKLQDNTIDETIKKQSKTIILFTVLIILNIFYVATLLMATYLKNNTPNAIIMIYNLVTLVCWTIILQWNHEIRNILKVLKKLD